MNYVGMSATQKKQALEQLFERAEIDPRGGDDSDEDTTGRTFDVGQWIDCRDANDQWLRATVASVTDDDVRAAARHRRASGARSACRAQIWVHYDGYNKKYDECLPKVAPLTCARTGC